MLIWGMAIDQESLKKLLEKSDVKAATYLKLRQKAAKKPLSPRELEQYDQIEAELQAQIDAEQNPSPVIVLTTAQLSHLFDITRQAIQNWKNLGCPGNISHGHWDLKAVLKWWLDNMYSGTSDEDESINDVKRKYWTHKAEGERIRVEKEKGRLVSLDDVLNAWIARLRMVRSGLDSWVDRLPPLLEGKSRKEIAKLLRGELWTIYQNFFKDGIFCRTRQILSPSKQQKKKPSGQKKT